MSPSIDVFLLPRHFEADDLRGGIAVVIDVLRPRRRSWRHWRTARGASCLAPESKMPKGSRRTFRAGDALLAASAVSQD